MPSLRRYDIIVRLDALILSSQIRKFSVDRDVCAFINRRQQNFYGQRCDVQDQGLDLLHGVILRQKSMAQQIGVEVTQQNHLIDDIGERGKVFFAG
jgi:hypothetical protein